MKGTAEDGPHVGGSGGILRLKILEFLALGKAISGILRRSQSVLMSHFLT